MSSESQGSQKPFPENYRLYLRNAKGEKFLNYLAVVLSPDLTKRYSLASDKNFCRQILLPKANLLYGLCLLEELHADNLSKKLFLYRFSKKEIFHCMNSDLRFKPLLLKLLCTPRGFFDFFDCYGDFIIDKSGYKESFIKCVLESQNTVFHRKVVDLCLKDIKKYRLLLDIIFELNPLLDLEPKTPY